jgi:hypothetical protein
MLCTLALSLIVIGQPLEMRAAELSLAVDARTGQVLELRDEVAGQPLLGPTPAPMFQLQLAGDDGAQRWLDSTVAEEVRAETTNAGLSLTYLDVAGAGDATVRIRARDEAVCMEIDLRPAEGVIVEQVVFPVLRLARPMGEVGDDRLFVPGGDGYVAHADGLANTRWHRREYPGHASMQLVAYYDDATGLSLICEDAAAHPKLLGGTVEEEYVDISPWLKLAAEPGETFVSPTLTLRRCAGSWMDAAADYRGWARGQWWAEPRHGDDAPPQWIADSPLTLSASFRPMGNGRWFVPLDRWDDLARIWREATGARSVMIESRNWEHHGIYTSPDYFPLNPSPEVVAATLSEAHDAGAHVQAMVAGLKWVIEREPYHTPHYNVLGFDGRQAFEDRGRQVCVVGPDGEVRVDEPYFSWDGVHAYICPGTEFAREHFRRTARGLAEAGFDLFEFDQMNGGSSPPCYSASHDHPIGPGPWIHESIADLMQITREEGRRINPGFGISMEDPGELLLAHLDTYISRADRVSGWPAAGTGTEVVPAFLFVYHPLMPVTSIDIQHTTHPDPMLVLRTARAFIAGAGLSTQLTEWQVLADYGEEDLFPTPAKMDPDQLAMLRACVATRDGPGQPYLVEGEMLPVPQPRAPIWRVETEEWDGTEMRPATYQVPALLVSAWRAPDGHIAVVLANPTPEPRGIDLSLTPLATSAAGAIEAYLNGESLGAVPVSVPPRSVILLEGPG